MSEKYLSIVRRIVAFVCVQVYVCVCVCVCECVYRVGQEPDAAKSFSNASSVSLGRFTHFF
mgnify:CR=1 FL=1